MVASPGAGLPPEAMEFLARSDIELLPWKPDGLTRWTDRSGRLHVACWECGTPGGVSASDRSLVAVSGTPWPRRERWTPDVPLVDAVAAACKGPGRSPASELCDTYVVMQVDQYGTGTVTSDPLGLHPLYLAQQRGFTVVGDRADLVAEVISRCTGTPPVRDAMSGAWLSFAVYLIGDGTGFEEVRALPAGSVVRMGSGQVEIESTRTPWQFDPDDPLDDPEDVAEALSADVVSGLRHALTRSSDRPWFELSGGKDSRLVLAVALEAGLGSAFRFVTYGPEALPDVQIACQIADRFGLDHHRRSPSMFEAPNLSIAARYRFHVHRTSGLSNCHESRAPDQRTEPVISGLFGEAYRTANDGVARAQPSSWDDAAGRFRNHRKFGDAGLLRPAVAEQLLDAGVAHHLEPRSGIRGPEDLRPVDWFRCHLPRWQGPLIDSHENRVLPLYSPTAIRASFGMGAEARSREDVHRLLITRASRDLAEIPFANDSWRTDNAPQPPPKRGSLNARRTARPRSEPARAQVVFDLLEACPDSPLFEMVDPARLRRAAERYSSLAALEQQQVLGAVTSLIWLGHLEQSPRADEAQRPVAGTGTGTR